jgi:hypothetical protein
LPLYTFGIKRTLGPNKRAQTGSGDHCVPGDVGNFNDYGADDSPQENYFLDELLLAQVWPSPLFWVTMLVLS